MPPLTDETRFVRQGVRTPTYLTPIGWLLMLSGLGVFAIGAAGLVAWAMWGGR